MGRDGFGDEYIFEGGALLADLQIGIAVRPFKVMVNIEQQCIQMFILENYFFRKNKHTARAHTSADFFQEQEPVFAEAVAFVQAERERLGLNEPFDVIKMGMTPDNDPAEAAAHLNSAAKAGATWWLELLMPEVYGLNPTDPQAYTVLRNRVIQGPPTAG